MNLTDRQIQIITHLKNCRDWVSSDKIASVIHTNKRTVQSEVKNLINNSSIKISSNQKLGYKLIYLSDEIKQNISKRLSFQKVYSSMNERASSLLLYLLFQTDYVSMQKLADTFFLSKTAVSIEIGTIQRWLSRRPNIELNVSTKNGIKVISSEDSKRIFASLVCNEFKIKNACLEEDVQQMFSKFYPKILCLLQRFFLNECFIISGEDVYRFGRYITFIIIRDRLGFVTEPNKEFIIKQKHILDELVYSIEKETGFHFSTDNQSWLITHFLELNQLSFDITNSEEIYYKLEEFESKVSVMLSIPKKSIDFRTESIVNHIKTMINRIKSGNNILNHFALMTLKEYPLEAYIIRKIFPEIFGFLPNLAESSYLVLYLAEALRKQKNNLKVLLLTNHSTSIISSLHQKIYEMINYNINQVHTEPLYQFDTHIEIMNEFDLHISTEQEIIFRLDEFVYLPTLLNKEEQQELTMRLQRIISERENKIKENIIESYYPEKNKLFLQDKIDQADFNFISDLDTISFPIKTDTLFVCKIHAGNCTFIKEYCMKKSIKIDKRGIRRIVFAQYNEDPKDIFMFFKVISELVF